MLYVPGDNKKIKKKAESEIAYTIISISSVDREAGLAQGIRGTCFEHPLLVYNLGGLRPLGKHDQCYSGTAWCAVLSITNFA